jgi:hypothetical protein
MTPPTHPPDPPTHPLVVSLGNLSWWISPALPRNALSWSSLMPLGSRLTKTLGSEWVGQQQWAGHTPPWIHVQ